MLSYRHSFHAGNFADILKHIVLVEVIQHFIKKDKPFDYIDTHSGAGLFDLASPHAQKLSEHSNGIAKLNPNDWPELSAYFKVIGSHNKHNSNNIYPGSPMLASYFLRPDDKAWLYELHPTDFTLLHNNMKTRCNVRVMNQDGMQGVLSLLPPKSRRGLIIIDPSYEIKEDYEKVFVTLQNAYKKFSTGTFTLWYPVVERKRIDRLIKQFRQSGIKNIQLFELGVSADSLERGMTASGMLVINPPWTLLDSMSTILPKLTAILGKEGAFYKSEVLVPE